MADEYQDNEKECREDRRNRKETVENRERRIQPPEELAGRYHPCLQLGFKCNEKSFSDETDNRYGKAVV